MSLRRRLTAVARLGLLLAACLSVLALSSGPASAGPLCDGEDPPPICNGPGTPKPTPKPTPTPKPPPPPAPSPVPPSPPPSPSPPSPAPSPAPAPPVDPYPHPTSTAPVVPGHPTQPLSMLVGVQLRIPAAFGGAPCELVPLLGGAVQQRVQRMLDTLTARLADALAVPPDHAAQRCVAGTYRIGLWDAAPSAAQQAELDGLAMAQPGQHFAIALPRATLVRVALAERGPMPWQLGSGLTVKELDVALEGANTVVRARGVGRKGGVGVSFRARITDRPFVNHQTGVLAGLRISSDLDLPPGIPKLLESFVEPALDAVPGASRRLAEQVSTLARRHIPYEGGLVRLDFNGVSVAPTELVLGGRITALPSAFAVEPRVDRPVAFFRPEVDDAVAEVAVTVPLKHPIGTVSASWRLRVGAGAVDGGRITQAYVSGTSAVVRAEVRLRGVKPGTTTSARTVLEGELTDEAGQRRAVAIRTPFAVQALAPEPEPNCPPSKPELC